MKKRKTILRKQKCKAQKNEKKKKEEACGVGKLQYFPHTF
jgi:hypothetical protein